MKAKASTMAQRFGFADPDLTTPEHDSLLMWLDANVDAIVRERMGELDREVWHRERTWDNYVFKPFKGALPQVVLDGLVAYPLEPTTFRIEKKWECPILDKSYTIGFCDMRVSISRKRENAAIELIDNDLIKSIGGRTEKATWWMEIKPSIPSVGELVRQLRMYQSYTTGDKWFVVSPDTRWCSQIESQGFGFIEAMA